MKKQYQYEEVIGQKLNKLTPPVVAGLWEHMENILNREMPQQEENRKHPEN